MKAKEKMQSVTRLVKSASSSIRREMTAITLSDRMEMLPDAEIKHALASAIKELEGTLKELRKY